jgi:hypothetical protein
MPQHSLEYLHFLARKRKREREENAVSEETNDMSADSMLVDQENAPPAKIPRKTLTQMIVEMWDEVMVGRTQSTS